MKSYLIITLSIIGIFFSACTSSKNIPIKSPMSSLINDENKAYVIFANTTSSYALNIGVDVMEFDSKTFIPKYIGTLTLGEKYIHTIQPGSHYFCSNTSLSNYIPSEKITYIDAKAGGIYYVNVLTSGHLISSQRDSIISTIQSAECNDKSLKRYGFFSNQNNPFESNLLSLSIKCENNKVSSVLDERFFSKAAVDEAALVQASEESIKKFHKGSLYQKRIQELFPIMVNKHANVFTYHSPLPRTGLERYSIEVLKATEDHKANIYEGLQLSESNIINTNDKNYVHDFDKAIKEKLTTHKIASDKGVIIEYEILNYVHGNQAVRYAGLTDMQRLDGMASLRMIVKFKESKTGDLLGEITYTSLISFGVFGGVGELLNDAVDPIIEYAKMNYLK